MIGSKSGVVFVDLAKYFVAKLSAFCLPMRSTTQVRYENVHPRNRGVATPSIGS